MGLATVTEVKGNVFVKDIAGNITKLQAGDVIESGQIVFGADEGVSYTVSFAESGKEQTFVGIAPQLFDVTMVPSLADVEETVIHPASANPFAQSIMSPEELAALVAENDDKGEDIPDETVSGQEAPKEGESTGDTFADRTGAQTDVNSDLRKAKFFGVSHDYKQEDIFHREDVDRLGTTSNQNQITPTAVTPIYPTTTYPIPTVPTSPNIPLSSAPVSIPLRGILNLDGDISVAEGGSAYYTLNVDTAPKSDLLITVSVGHITTEDGDLLPHLIAVTIPAGTTSIIFPIENNIDAIYEGPEDYRVSIISTNGGGYDDLSIGNSSVITTIVDNDVLLPTLMIDDQTINEQEGTMTFTVTLSAVAGGDVTFNYATSDVSATAGADYSSVSGIGTITAGTLTTTITVPIHDDYIADNGETFNVILSNPSANATIADGVGVGTILDDTVVDPYTNPGIIESDTTDTITIRLFALDESGNRVSMNEVMEGLNPNYIAVAFDKNGTELELSGTVQIAFMDGSATGSGTDYVSMSRTVGLGVAFTTTTIDDILPDNGETFTVAIVDRSFSGATTYESVRIDTTPVMTTIVDDDVLLPTLTIDDQTINEQEGTMTFTVTLSAVVGGDVTFNYATSDISATAGADYSSVSGIGTISAGTLTTTITVPIHDDYIADNGETFNVILSNPSANATIADGVGVGTIFDNPVKMNQPTVPTDPMDPNNPDDGMNYGQEDTVYVVIEGPISVNEGDMTTNYTIKIVDQNGMEVVVTKETKITVTYNNTTTQNGDTQHNNGDTIDVTIPVGSSSNTVSVQTNDDLYKDDGESFKLTITGIENTGEFENAIIGDKNGDYKNVTTTIYDNTTPAIETDADVAEIVIVAVTSATTTIADITGTDGKLIITNTNVTSEGGTLYYIPVAIDTDGKPLAIQDGKVDISYGVTSDPLDADATSGIDYTNTLHQTNIGEVFSIKTNTDSTGEIDENFEVIISNPTGTSYETPVVNDAHKTVTSTIEDSVYVKIIHNDEQIEGNDLTHTLVLVDKNGNPIDVNIPAGEILTVTLAYTSDETIGADYSSSHTQNGTITVDFTAGTTSTKTIANTTLDDFVSDSPESYILTITNFTQSNASYQFVGVYIPQNNVTGTILDGVTLGTPNNASVDEDNFDISAADNKISDTKLLNIVSPSGDNNYKLLFDAAVDVKDPDTNGSIVLTSNTQSITFDYSIEGKIVATRTDGEKVFEITLNKNGVGGSDDSYTYTQYQNIDHPDVNSDDNVVLTFGYKIEDQGQTSGIQNFTVTVNDSMPSSAHQNITLNEDTSKLIILSDESFLNGNITLNNGDGDTLVTNGNSIDIYDNTTDKNTVGTLTNNGDGTLTFTPTTNYSGGTAGFTYSVSDNDGDTATATIAITVNPIADKPDMNGANAGLNGSTIKTTPQVLEDNNNNPGVEGGMAYTATIGLILPQISDYTDRTAANLNDDQPEKLGLITLKSSTIETITAGGIDYVVDSSGLTIFINDIPNYHYAGLGAGDADISLTQAEFAAIVVKFENDNAVNPKFTVSVDEYEVNDDNTVDLSVPKASNSQGYEVDILAVTDPITLAWDATGGLGVISTSTNANDTFTFTTVDEGVAVIDLKALLTNTSGLENDTDGDLDGSEHRSYTISGIPEGTIITLGTKSVAAGSDGIATISFPDNTADDPTFTMTINEQYSGTINGTITLNVTDSDSDSSGTITTESASVNFMMTINPIADQVTLKVAQAQGDEDAGRTHGNDEANNSTIDAPQNGIALNINVISDDSKDIGPSPINLKETYTVTIDKVPDGGSLYVYDNGDSSWKLVSVSDDGTSVTIDGNSVLTSGNISVDATADGTYKVTIADYQNDHLCKFIPPYNSDADYTGVNAFNVSAYSVDGTDDSSALTQTLQIDVTVEGIADIPVHDDLATDTATDDDNDSNVFTIVSAEDSGNINLKDAFATPNLLDSNDGVGTETLTFKVTGLADGFSVNGATFIGGSGENRVWLVDKAALNTDTVTLSTPVNYAGEVDFKIQFVTTENSGDSKTHQQKDVSLMIKPVAEATAIVNSSDTQDEDTSKTLNFGFSTPDTDGASAGHESLQSFSIDVTGLQAAGVTLVSNGVDLTTGKTGHQTVTVTNGVLADVIATLKEDSNADYSFKISYTYQDVAVDSHGNTYTNTVTKSDQPYNVTVNAITDDISLAMSTTTGANNSVDGSGHVTVTGNGTFTKTLTVTGLDSDGRGSPDTDGSEQFTRVTVSGVPEGITVGGIHGTYAGDTGGGNYSGFWYVDIPNDALDPSGTYNLVFDVDGSFADNLPDYPITVTAYSEDASNGVEQSDSQSFILTIDNPIVGPGPGTPADITAFYQDIDQDNFLYGTPNAGSSDHNYVVSSAPDTTITDADAYPNSVLKEDTQFRLSDVIHVETNTTGASSTAFSITLKNVPAGVIVEGMTLNANGFYTLSGSGDQNAIVAKLQSILITPALNQNTDANNISNTDLAFDIELTTYAAGGASNTALINFSGSVLPVTDEMNLSVVNDGSTNEDTDQTFSITLGEGADGANTQIVDGKVYIKLTENYSDLQGGDGTNGSLSYNGNPIVVTAVSGVSGIADGNYYVITGVTNNQTLNFTYTPALNRDGSITVDTYVKNVESENWNPYNPDEIVSHESFSFDVNAVTDGFTLASATATGNEDGMIPLGITLTSSDSSEKIASVSISGVPNGFLLYYGANAGSAVIAQNLGTTGTTTSIEMTYGNPENVYVNTWNIPLSGGALPAYIGIKAPDNWSGTIPTITINSVDEDGNSSSDTLDITIDPVVDTLTLNTTKTFGDEGDDILLNLNANVQDLDGSETLKLELTGLGADASFKANGIEIDSSHISYVGDTYTITDIAASDINALSFVQSAMNGNVNVSAYMVESDGSTSGAVNSSFNVNIAAVYPTGGDDTLLYKGSAIDGGAGTDTLIFKNIDSIDMSGINNISNIEKIDMSGNGNQTLSGLSLDQIFLMTDSSSAHTLTINGNTGDTVATVDRTGWAKAGETTAGAYTEYSYTKGTDTVTVKIDTDHLTNSTNLH